MLCWVHCRYLTHCGHFLPWSWSHATVSWTLQPRHLFDAGHTVSEQNRVAFMALQSSISSNGHHDVTIRVVHDEEYAAATLPHFNASVPRHDVNSNQVVAGNPIWESLIISVHETVVLSPGLITGLSSILSNNHRAWLAQPQPARGWRHDGAQLTHSHRSLTASSSYCVVEVRGAVRQRAGVALPLATATCSGFQIATAQLAQTTPSRCSWSSLDPPPVHAMNQRKSTIGI